MLASLLVVASVAGCKKKKSDATTDQGSGSAMTASGSGSDQTMTPPPAGSGSGPSTGSSTGSGSSTSTGSSTGSGSGSGAADTAVAIDPAVLTKLAAIKADSLIDASGKPEVPVKGSVQDYVTAVAHANGVGAATLTTVGCGDAGGECVAIAGDPCPDGAPEDCEGLALTLVIDPATGKLAGATIAGEAVDPKLLANKKALRKAIDDAYSEAP